MVLGELGELAAGDKTEAELRLLRDLLHFFAKGVFSGWGQTKVIEDGLQRVRDKETRDTTNRRMTAARAYRVLHESDVAALHGREDFEPTGELMKGDMFPKDIFGITESVPSMDSSSLVGPATWPLCSAQSGQVVACETALLRLVAAQGRDEAVSGCWKCAFVPAGTLLQAKRASRCSLAWGMWA